MNSLSVQENIAMCEGAIKKLLEQRTELEKELLRVEGSLRVFTQLKEVGVETIQIKNKPEFVLENTEVIDEE